MEDTEVALVPSTRPMLNHPVSSTVLIVLSGFLLSVLSMFVTDPYCRKLQTERLSAASKQQVDLVCQDIQNKVDAVAKAGEQLFPHLADLSEDELSHRIEHLLDLSGAFTVEVSQREPTPDSIKATANKTGKAMRRGRFPSTYLVAAISSKKRDVSQDVGTERIYQIVRMVFQNGGTMISRPHEFYAGDRFRTGIATTLGRPEKTPDGLLVVTFDDLVASQHLTTDEVALTVSEINLSNNAVRAKADYELLNADEHSYEAEAKIAGRVFRFSVREQPGANFHPHWIKWGTFLLCNALSCVVGLTWLQRGRAELIRRNLELEREVTRRIAMEKHLQATIDFRDHERELIAHEIHDGFVQDVIGAQMFAEAAAALAEPNSQVGKQTASISELLGHSIDEARKTIDYLKPRVVDELGLVAALRDSIEQDMRNYQFKTELHCDEDLPRFPILVERMLYRIIREAVSNARQHSGCDRATINLSADAEGIFAEISDEGIGFQEDSVRSDSFGLPGIRRRIEMMNGEFSLNSSDSGTNLIVRIPGDLEALELPPNESLMLKV